MKMTITLAALAVALFAAPAVAQTPTTVGSTSQLGSVLIFPHVTVATGTDTFIEISNHSAGRSISNAPTSTRKRVELTSASRSAATGQCPGTSVPVPVTGLPYRCFRPVVISDRLDSRPQARRLGELVCFAVDPTYNYQVEFNHLYGTATVLDLAVTGRAPSRSRVSSTTPGASGRGIAMAVLLMTTHHRDGRPYHFDWDRV